MNKKFQNALKRETQKVPPIWMMRQAGRYQASYRKLREEHSFVNLCKVPELSAQVGLNAVKEFDFDLCILFSDILFPLEALGMGLEYSPAPKLGWNLRKKEDFLKLKSTEEAFEKMLFQADCLKATRSVLPDNKSLIGFVGGLWTLFGYSVEGSHKGGMLESKKHISLYQNFVDQHLFPLIEKNIQLQLDNHAEVVMVFDTAVGEVSPLVFRSLIQPHLEKLSLKFPNKLGYYTKGTTEAYFTKEFLDLPWAGIGWDQRWSLPQVLEYKSKGFIQGNFDQVMLHQNFSDFKVTLDRYLEQFKNISDESLKGWVAGLGHGVLPKTPEDNVKFYVEHVREFFLKR